MVFIVLGIVILIALITFIAIIIYNFKDDFTENVFEDPKRKAGRIGEQNAISVINSILRNGDYLFSNVNFIYDNRPVELDCVVLNKYGVFIIEVKNYIGHIVGEEDDYEWKKYKTTYSGNVYEKSVKNPIKQVKRQIYLLAKYLDYYGVNVWVKGYALLMHKNSPVNSDYILSSIGEIDKAIHKKDRKFLLPSTIEEIKNLLQ